MRSILLIYFLLITLCFGQSIPDFALYLGQTPPVSSSKMFLTQVSNGMFTAQRITISKDGKELYYSELNNYPITNSKIKYYRYSDNKWNGPFTLFENFTSPALINNDSILLFQTSSPEAWYSIRKDTGWSTPHKFLNSSVNLHYLQVSNSGKFYASSYPANSIGGADFCELEINGSDTTAKSLGLPLNTVGDDLDFFISQDESYIIFASPNRNGFGSGDLFISYHNSNGGWTNPKNLGSLINTNGWEWGPYITPDKNYLFFSHSPSPDSRIFWVRLGNLIDSLKHTNFPPYLRTQIHDQIDTIGIKFSFHIPDSTFIDDDGNETLTYSASLNDRYTSPLPSWLSFDPVTKLFSGSPTEAKSYNIKLTVTDSANIKALCIFKITAANPTSAEDEKLTPDKFELFQNYPNPFNPVTTIYYTIPAGTRSGEFVQLKVYDVPGNEIATLVNEEKKPGKYSVKFDSSHFASGIYFYCLKTGNFTIQKKMVILR